MSVASNYELASWARWILPWILTVAIFVIPWVRWRLFRAIVAVLAGWFSTVALTIYLYNPAGIAYGYSIGQDSPEMHYDNNTSAVALIVGWVVPLAICLTIAAAEWIRARHGAKSIAPSSSNSLERPR